jgi:hypothetical protein
MAKRKAARGKKSGKSGRKPAAARRVATRRATKRSVKRQASARKKAPVKKASKKRAPKPGVRKKMVARAAPKPAKRATSSTPVPGKIPRLDRARRTLEDAEPHSTPSSLDLDRRGSAVRTGRAEAAQNIREHHGMDGVTGGDPDVDIEDAYFAGEEAPGGDNPTPDQDIVEDIGKALGVTYNDNEELKGADKLVERDKHRWEMDPASAEDYTEHDKE